MNAEVEVLTALGCKGGLNCVSHTVCSEKRERLNPIRSPLVISNQPQDGWKSLCALQSKGENTAKIFTRTDHLLRHFNSPSGTK